MEHSVVYGRIHFLRELSNADATTRKLLLRYMTAGQMEALGEVIRYIVNGSIWVLPQDARYFRERSLVLRQIFDRRISLRRKRNSLITYHDMVPRLLRPTYINNAAILSIRSVEQ